MKNGREYRAETLRRVAGTYRELARVAADRGERMEEASRLQQAEEFEAAAADTERRLSYLYGEEAAR